MIRTLPARYPSLPARASEAPQAPPPQREPESHPSVLLSAAAGALLGTGLGLAAAVREEKASAETGELRLSHGLAAGLTGAIAGLIAGAIFLGATSPRPPEEPTGR